VDVFLGLAIVAWMAGVAVQAIRATPTAERDDRLAADVVAQPEAAPDRPR